MENRIASRLVMLRRERSLVTSVALPSVRRSSVGHFEEWNGCDITKEGRLPFLSWLTKASFFSIRVERRRPKNVSFFSFFRHLARTSDFVNFGHLLWTFLNSLFFHHWPISFLVFYTTESWCSSLIRNPRAHQKRYFWVWQKQQLATSPSR